MNGERKLPASLWPADGKHGFERWAANAACGRAEGSRVCSIGVRRPDQHENPVCASLPQRRHPKPSYTAKPESSSRDSRRG